MICPFTSKTRFRWLKFPSQQNEKDPNDDQQNEKDPNEDQQRSPQTLGCGLGRFIRLFCNHCKYPHSYLNVRMRSRRKFHLKTLVKKIYTHAIRDITNFIPRDN